MRRTGCLPIPSGMRIVLYLLLTVCVAVATFAVVDRDSLLPQPTGPAVTTVLAEHTIPEHGATLGDPAAPVTLIEVIDLECGPAAIAYRASLPPVIARFVRTGQVKVRLVVLADLGEKARIGQQVFDRLAAKNLAWEWADQVFKTPRGPGNSRSMAYDYLHERLGAIPGGALRRPRRNRGGRSAGRTGRRPRARALARHARLRSGAVQRGSAELSQDPRCVRSARAAGRGPRREARNTVTGA